MPKQQGSASTLRFDTPLEFQTQAHTPYQHMEADSYEEALAVVQDTHYQALMAVHLLEDEIEQLSQQVNMDDPTAMDGWVAVATPTADNLAQLATTNRVPLQHPTMGTQ